MVNVTINGVVYPYPERTDTSWGAQATAAFVALAGSAIYSGGSPISYLTSATANPSTTGFIRMAKTDSIKWRDNANSADLALDKSTGDRLRWATNQLAYNSEIIPLVTPVTAGNFPKLKADGSLEDSGIVASSTGPAVILGGLAGMFIDMVGYSAPSTTFPAYCVSNADATLSTSNWPDLVPYLRGLKAIYKPGITGEASDYILTNWAVSSNVATLTFNNDNPNNAILGALVEDQLIQGSYSNWRTVTIPVGGIGNIPAGDYWLTNVDSSARTVTFNVTASDGSGSTSATVNFYLHRIPSSTITARWLQVAGRTMMTPNDAEMLSIGGLRRRDRFQGHFHSISDPTHAHSQQGSAGNNFAAGPNYSAANAVPSVTIGVTTANPTNIQVQTPSSDSFGDGNPRYGITTEPRHLTGFRYIWGVQYVP